MRISYTKNIVQVIGHIWQPGISVCAQEYTLSDNDLIRYGISKTEPTRKQIQKWISTNTGDFSSIDDFSANIGEDQIIPWDNSESEVDFNDCMFPQEDLSSEDIQA